MMITPLLALTDRGEWRPGIGDPTIMGWLTVVAYFVAAAFCFRLALIVRARVPGEGRKQFCIFWTAFAVLMTFLGVNKQLDLQTWLTQVGRRMAENEGWYEYRRPVQALFVVFVAVAGFTLLVCLVRLARSTLRHSWVALAGAVFLGCFILVRAASFHHVDGLLKTDFRGVKANWVLELGGIFWITLGAWLNLRRIKSAAGAPQTPSQTSTRRRS
ncbi:MAG: hypothetical protein L0Z50_20310 [Verrucomicrobiales bacterium]|nr:hypothetical protein [Verrucomicrobiales bacterium]